MKDTARGIAAVRIAAAVLVTLLLAASGAFVVLASPEKTGVVVTAVMGLILAATWFVVLREPWCITVGDEVVIRFPFGTRRYARQDLVSVDSVIRFGGIMLTREYLCRPPGSGCFG